MCDSIIRAYNCFSKNTAPMGEICRNLFFFSLSFQLLWLCFIIGILASFTFWIKSILNHKRYFLFHDDIFEVIWPAQQPAEMGTLLLVIFKGYLSNTCIWNNILILLYNCLIWSWSLSNTWSFFWFFVLGHSKWWYDWAAHTYLLPKLFQETAYEAITFLSQSSTLILKIYVTMNT